MDEMPIEPEDELMYAAIEEAARLIFEGKDFSLVGVVEDGKGTRSTFEVAPEEEAAAMITARKEVSERNARAFAVIGLGSMEVEPEGEEGTPDGGDEVPVLVVYRQGPSDAQVEVYVAPFSVGKAEPEEGEILEDGEEDEDSMEIGELESHGVLPESWLG